MAGGGVAVATRWQRSVRIWVNLHAQSNLTFEAGMTAPLLSSGTSTWTPRWLWWANEQGWTIDFDGHGGEPLVRVTGVCRDGRIDPDPIVIQDCGAEFSDQIIAALTAAYRARGWAYRVVAEPVARSQPKPK